MMRKNVHYADLETVLKNSDYISLHCPLTPATRHLINADTLALMKPTAFPDPTPPEVPSLMNRH